MAFDLDGTLYPNISFNIRLLPFILKEARHLMAFGKARSRLRSDCENAAQKTDEPACSFYRKQAVYMSGILGTGPERLEEKNEKLIYRGWEPLFKKVRLFSHVPETLKSLRENGVKLGLLSDFPPLKKIENLGIGGIWDAVLCSEAVGRLKPDPLPFIKLAEALACPPEEILYVGNSFSYDVLGAKKTGMKTAWIRSRTACFFPDERKKHADFVFFDYRQLCNFVLT